MRRLRPLDKALLVTLVPLWTLFFALYVNRLVHGRGVVFVPLVVSASENADGYPTVSWIWRETGSAAPGLAVGDQLLRLGNADLRGVGPLGFLARSYEEVSSAALPVPISFLRTGEHHETLLGLRSIASSWQFLPFTLGFGVTAILVFLRLPDPRFARAFLLTGLAVSFSLMPFSGESRALIYTSMALLSVSSLLVFPLGLCLLLLFPDDGPSTSARLPVWPWLFAVSGPIVTSMRFGVPLPPVIGHRAYPIVLLAGGTAVLLLVTRHFRQAGPLSRRQLKWVLYGFYLGTVPTIVVGVVRVFYPSLGWLFYTLVPLALAFIPLCIFVAIVRFNLFDIDRLISATAAYTILSVLLLAGMLMVIPHLSQMASSIVGVDPAVGQTVFSLLLAALIVPGQRYLRPQIERLFFVERYALEQGVEHLLQELSGSEGPQALLTLAGERLDALLRPECCVMYGRAGDAYLPLFVRGRVVPPVVAARSLLIGMLQAKVAPVNVEHWRQRVTHGVVGPADYAVLDSLGAAVLLPIGRSETLAAFICLDQKRSGDVYTSTDLALLAAVADKVSGELLRFDEAEIRHQARAMQDALRRYVPEPIAARVVSGRGLEAGEREISVLFVDIRGYSTYSEGRTAEEIFSTVNRYTETVSRVVRQRGGTVVEFNGDGMMAVFGAPEPLAEKERSAVTAGREIVAAVRSLALGKTKPESQSLEVGVGIATGQAFVGNIQSVDRFIWSAIGNTTNLAARLQSLTRDLAAAMVIDARTWAAAGNAASDFESREQVPIRGRHQSEDVYVLPLTAPALRAPEASA